jgi:hypothetical protein
MGKSKRKDEKTNNNVQNTTGKTCSYLIYIENVTINNAKNTSINYICEILKLDKWKRMSFLRNSSVFIVLMQ